jgi:hypothetical protein
MIKGLGVEHITGTQTVKEDKLSNSITFFRQIEEAQVLSNSLNTSFYSCNRSLDTNLISHL